MRLSAIGLMLTLTLVIFVVPDVALAQQPGKVPLIGFLSTRFPSDAPSSEAFRQELRALGWVEGQNIIIEWRYAEGRAERLPDLAAELVRLPVDVIVAAASPATRAAQHATRTIPIVMVNVYDPVGEGFVASLARPGGNITGLSSLGADFPGKRLELLKDMIPQIARVAVLTNPASSTYEPKMHNLTVAARALGLHLHVVELHSPDELDPAFAAMTRASADAIILMEDAVLLSDLRGRTVDLAATHQLPAMYDWKMLVDAGGLMSYGPSMPATYRHAATYVDKILKGTKPADLPVEQPMKFELVINLKTAKALGLTIPQSVLLRADEIIQ